MEIQKYAKCKDDICTVSYNKCIFVIHHVEASNILVPKKF